MPDREKVLKALKHCISEITCRRCPYEKIECTITLKKDVLALLKEQEAVEPEVEVLNEIDRLYKCPRCHKHFFYKKQKFCDQCGQAVKWNEP